MGCEEWHGRIYSDVPFGLLIKETVTMKGTLTYMYCNCCGHRPDTGEPMNVYRRYWECDDGWTLAALCPSCWDEDFSHAKPKPGDYAYEDSRDDIVTGDPMEHIDIDPMEII